MGTRGRDEHHKFKFGDFQFRKTSDGAEFIEFSRERGTKTRTGETERSTNAVFSNQRCGLSLTDLRGVQ